MLHSPFSKPEGWRKTDTGVRRYLEVEIVCSVADCMFVYQEEQGMDGSYYRVQAYNHVSIFDIFPKSLFVQRRIF